MPLGINNPLVRRVKRHASMSILFRTADPISPPLSQSGWYEAFAPPETADFAPPIVEENAPEEIISPLDRAIRRAEGPAAVRQTPPAVKAISSPPAESPAIKAPDSVGEPIAPVLPEVEPAQPPGIQREVADTSPPAESGPSQVESSDQDWGGAWGRLRNIMRRHEAQQELSDVTESPAEAEPSRPKPTPPKRLADVQRRTTAPSRMPPPGERRRARVEYIKPGQPPAAPDQPGESQPEIPEGAIVPEQTVQRQAEAATTATSGPIAGESPERPLREEPAAQTQTEDAVPVVPSPEAGESPELQESEKQALSHMPEKPADAVPAVAGAVEAPEPISEPAITKTPVQKQGEPTLEGPSVKDDAQPMIPVEPEGSFEASPAQEEAAPVPTTMQDTAMVEVEQAPPVQQPQQIQSKEAEVSPPPAVSVTEFGEPESLSDETPEEGLGKRLLGAARRLFGGDRPSEPKTVQREEGRKVEKTSPADPLSFEMGPQVEETSAIGPDLSDMPVGAARAVDETPQDDVFEAYLTADSEPIVPGEVRGATPTAGVSSPFSTTPERGEKVIPAEIRETSPEIPPPAYVATPAKPPETSATSIQRETSSAPPPPDAEAATAEETAARPAEMAPEKPAELPGASETLPVASEGEGDDVETVIQATPDSNPRQPVQSLPLDQVWPVKQVAGEPSKETRPEYQSAEKTEASEGTVIQRRTSGGDESAAQVDQALRKVTPGQKSDSAVELVTPRRPRPVAQPEESAAEEPPAAPPPEDLSRDEALPEAGLTPEPVASQLSPVEPPGAAPESIQRQIDESLATPAPAERSSQEEQHEMVPTEIGDLPRDFWALLGQEPPKPSPASKPPAMPPSAAQSPPGSSAIQRAQSGEAKAQTAVADAPTAQRPSLDQFISREWQVPLIQRADAEQDVSTSTSERSAAEETRQKGPSAEEIEKLAQAVYAQLKRRLAIERERTRGRY